MIIGLSVFVSWLVIGLSCGLLAVWVGVIAGIHAWLKGMR
jgi:hypothetical protein